MDIPHLPRFYVKLSTFGKGNDWGGHWEKDQLIDSTSYKEAFNTALAIAKESGWAFEIKITICDANGEEFI